MERYGFGVLDFGEMKEIERAMLAVLIPMVQNKNPILAMFALIRCARVMLRKGAPEAQKVLLPVLFAYLEGKNAAPGAPSILWSPDGGLQ